MSEFSLYIGIIGGFCGIVSIIWHFYDSFSSYLRVAVECSDYSEKTFKIKCMIDNGGFRRKIIDKAFVLISNDNKDLIDIGREIANYLSIPQNEINYSNDFILFETEKPIFDDTKDFCLVPLPFFYSEQVHISDEELSFSFFLEKDKLIRNQSYSIRFFIYNKKRLHRSTQDSVIVD